MDYKYFTQIIFANRIPLPFQIWHQFEMLVAAKQQDAKPYVYLFALERFWIL